MTHAGLRRRLERLERMVDRPEGRIQTGPPSADVTPPYAQPTIPITHPPPPKPDRATLTTGVRSGQPHIEAGTLPPPPQSRRRIEALRPEDV